MRLVAKDRRVFMTWYVYIDGKKIFRKANVKYPGCKFNVVCSCGQELTTNGETEDYLYGLIHHHKLNVHNYQFELNCGCITDLIGKTNHNENCKANLNKMAGVK